MSVWAETTIVVLLGVIMVTLSIGVMGVFDYLDGILKELRRHKHE